MFIDKYSIKAKYGNNAYISLGEYLVEAKYGYNKLWAEDSGRNLAGSMTGTLLGIFPKLILQFRALNKDELEIIAPLLDSANQTVRYYDPTKKDYVEMTTYTGDYEVLNKNIISNDSPNEGFSCSFIASKKRL